MKLGGKSGNGMEDKEMVREESEISFIISVHKERIYSVISTATTLLRTTGK